MKNNNKPASAPRGAADATPAQALSGQTAAPWWVSLRQGLQLASQLVIASPVRLPAKVVTAAKFVSVALGIWDSLDGRQEAPSHTGGETAPSRVPAEEAPDAP